MTTPTNHYREGSVGAPKRWPTLVLAILAVALLAGACGNSDEPTTGELFTPTTARTETVPIPPSTDPSPGIETEDGFDAALAAILPAGSPGAILRVDIGGETMIETAIGEVERGTGRPLTPEHPFRTASTTKPITAAAVLRLVEQGHLGLDDPIAGHLPADLVARLHVIDGVSRGDQITVRHLLTHSAGLADRPFDTPFVDEVGRDPGRVWQPLELVEYTIDHAQPVFSPGAGYAYADDGYVLLGMIIESVTGRPLHEVYRELILDPAAMDDTYLEGHEDPRGRELSHPYFGDLDATLIDPSTDWGGGGLVSTTADLIRFGRAVVDGTLFDDPATAEAMIADPGTGYGLGLYVITLGPGLTALGHDGFWGSALVMIPELDLVMAATTNTFVDTEARDAFLPSLIGLVLEELTPARPDGVTTVDVNGRAHVIYTAGEGTPTVVFESGLGAGLEAWTDIAGMVADATTVFAHDRAGFGQSDPVPGPRTGSDMVDELRAVLAAGGQQPPYVLVGHSFGGMLVELYARTHPDEVAGLILVDSRPAGFTERCQAALDSPDCNFTEADLDRAPEPIRSEMVATAEIEAQLLAAPALADVPAIVIAAARGQDPALDTIWHLAQADLAASLDAELIIADNSGHDIQRDRPDLVLDAIAELVGTTRGSPATHESNTDIEAGCLASDSFSIGAQSGLPAPVAARRDAIVAAAAHCDVAAAVELTGPGFIASFGGDDPATLWSVQERNGSAPFGHLIDTLRLPYATIDDGGHTIYVWPSASAYDSWDTIPDDDKAALEQIYGNREIAGFEQFGAFAGYRVGIAEDGTWLYFVGGD